MRAVQRLAPQQRGDLTRLLARVGLLQDPLLVLRAVAAPLRALDELWVGRRRARSRWPRSRSCSFERSFSAQSPSCPLSYQQCTAKLTTVITSQVTLTERARSLDLRDPNRLLAGVGGAAEFLVVCPY